MKFEESRPIETVPLHVVAIILGQLDSTQQLKVTVSSHRIFHHAFLENTLSTVRSVVANEIPENIQPFALALLESSQVDRMDSQAVPGVMRNLKHRTAYPALAAARLSSLTRPDLDFLSRNHAAVKSLGDKFHGESLPLFAKWLSPDNTHEATPGDFFRIYRALYRHQMMCNLLCPGLSRRNVDEATIESERNQVLLAFSPWVNEQLICIYYFLRRLVMEAYDDVAAHDIAWGEIPKLWTAEPWWIDAMENDVQLYLAYGLEFLSSLAKMETFDERIALFEQVDTQNYASSTVDNEMRISADPHDQMCCLMYYGDPWQAQGLDPETRLARVRDLGLLEPLASSLDGPDESTSSRSCQAWILAQSEEGYYETTFDHEADANLWVCGYVIWEASGQLPLTLFRRRIESLRQDPCLFQRLATFYDAEVIDRSQDMRTDLWLVGARGWWPLEGIDFSRVHGLDEKCKKRLLSKWANGEAGVVRRPLSKSIIAIARSMDYGDVEP